MTAIQLILQHSSNLQVIPVYTLTFDSSGIVLSYHGFGTAYAKPSPYSYMYVNYIAKLMNNAIFDSASNSNLLGGYIDQLIPGWQIGMQKIGVGGHIQLFIPSAYA